MTEDLGKFELNIDHPMLQYAKNCLNQCLKQMVAKAIETGSMEGTTALKISFLIADATDEATGEVYKWPEIDFKAQYSVPLKAGASGKIVEKSKLYQKEDGSWIMVNGQVTIDELMREGA